jgi:hypothetical protein
MKQTNVSRIVSLVPERISRFPSGSAFTLNGTGGSSSPSRLAHVARFLQWLSPLNPIDKEDQRALGLLAANGRGALPPGDDVAEELPEDVDPEETLPQ